MGDERLWDLLLFSVGNLVRITAINTVGLIASEVPYHSVFRLKDPLLFFFELLQLPLSIAPF